MSKLTSLKKCVSLVTGGASGLGQATVKRLVSKGSKVVVCDLPTSDGINFANTLRSEFGNIFDENCCIFAPADVTSETEVAAAVDLIIDIHGRLDVIVNCAAVSRVFSLYNFNKNLPTELHTIEDNLSVNATGSFNVIRLAVELMRKNEPNPDGQRGVIINTGSIAATDGGLGQVALAASKGAVSGMTLPIARDLAPYGIRCVTIAPGYMDTPINSNLPNDVRTFLGKLCAFPNTLGNPEAFAHAVQMVVENPMLNGEVIRLDAGSRPVF